MYATGSEVCKKLKSLEIPWRVSEGSGEAETTSKLSLTDDGVTSSKEKGVESYGIGE